MKSTSLLAFLLLISGTTLAQQNTASSAPGQTSFFAELGGPGILFSANVDRRFTKANLGFGGRIGIGFVTGDEYIYDTLGYSNYDLKSAGATQLYFR